MYDINIQDAKLALRIVCSIAKAKEEYQVQLLQDGILDTIFNLSKSSDEYLKYLSKVSDDFIRFVISESNTTISSDVIEFIKSK